MYNMTDFLTFSGYTHRRRKQIETGGGETKHTKRFLPQYRLQKGGLGYPPPF